MMAILADVAGGADPMISGNWLIGALIALIPVIGAVWIKGKAAGRTEASDNNVTLKKPVPTIQVREEQRFVGRDEFVELTARMTVEHTKLWSQFAEERKIWNHEIEGIQRRQDTQSIAIASLQGTVDEINKTVGTLLSIALKSRNPGTRS